VKDGLLRPEDVEQIVQEAAGRLQVFGCAPDLSDIILRIAIELLQRRPRIVHSITSLSSLSEAIGAAG
jgi:hypothetical protein